MIRFKDGLKASCLLVGLFPWCGCSENAPVTPIPTVESDVLATCFDATSTGVIHGRVTWTGDVPVVPPLEVRSLIFDADGAREKWLEPNPNAPVIDPNTRGIRNAVVFLRGVDSAHSRPWNHEPVWIEQSARRFQVHQGAFTGFCGFVRRGSRVEMVSRDPCLHVLHASGAAYFSLAFPDPDLPRVRALPQAGVVELTSAAGFFAMRAYLFVDDHPYYTRTDATGRFVLENVPPGRYELVGWMPNWLELRRDREPETGVVSRLFFRQPVEKVQDAVLQEKAEAELNLTFSVKDFSHE